MAEAVKDSAIRTYLKEKTNLRVEQGPVDRLVRHLTAKIDQIADRVLALAQMEERSTLLDRDMERAIEEIDSGSNGKDQTPEKVYGILSGYNVEQLGDVTRRIEEFLKQ
jgi:histone H3/H4